MQSKNFLICGEDKRQDHLSEMLYKKGYDTERFLIDGCVGKMENYDVFLLPVPETGKYYEILKNHFTSGQIIFGWNFPKEAEMFGTKKNIVFIDYKNQPGIAEKNAVATAEGLISEAICATSKNLYKRRTLVAGFGRCGSQIAQRLKAMQCDVAILEKDENKRKTALDLGYNVMEHADLAQVDLIINTIPELVFTKENLKNCTPDVAILDLASKPGGIDFSYCRQNGINARSCPGLPGKYAPESSAEILLDVILNNLS